LFSIFLLISQKGRIFGKLKAHQNKALFIRVARLSEKAVKVQHKYLFAFYLRQTAWQFSPGRGAWRELQHGGSVLPTPGNTFRPNQQKNSAAGEKIWPLIKHSTVYIMLKG
jgi:hypothetical protein